MVGMDKTLRIHPPYDGERLLYRPVNVVECDGVEYVKPIYAEGKRFMGLVTAVYPSPDPRFQYVELK